jgi:hypothetical protein
LISVLRTLLYNAHRLQRSGWPQSVFEAIGKCREFRFEYYLRSGVQKNRNTLICAKTSLCLLLEARLYNRAPKKGDVVLNFEAGVTGTDLKEAMTEAKAKSAKATPLREALQGETGAAASAERRKREILPTLSEAEAATLSEAKVAKQDKTTGAGIEPAKDSGPSIGCNPFIIRHLHSDSH